jgi:RNA polymerase sigma-70 factor (ECF subfamily)
LYCSIAEKYLNASPAWAVLVGERLSCMMEAAYIAYREPDLAEREEIAASEARFADLVKRQARFVYHVAYAVLRNPQDAEDAVQETFLRIYRTRAWKDIRDEKAFLARTAWRAAVKRLPKVRHEPLAPELSAESAPGPEATVITADWNAAVHRLVDALPEDLRQPLALSTVEELNSREIAEIMGIAEGTVRTRLMRARQILKQKLAALMKGRHEK